MSEERERMDVYTGSDEDEQIDMWLFNAGLRPQFDEIDNLALKRTKLVHGSRETGKGSTHGFWQKLTHHSPKHRHSRTAGTGS